jgi:hypothetical protein
VYRFRAGREAAAGGFEANRLKFQTFRRRARVRRGACIFTPALLERI